MKSLILFLVIIPNIAFASDWVIPPTGYVDYSNQGQPGTTQTFNIPQPSTVNNPLPEWSKPQAQPAATVQEYVPVTQPIYNFNE